MSEFFTGMSEYFTYPRTKWVEKIVYNFHDYHVTVLYLQAVDISLRWFKIALY